MLLSQRNEYVFISTLEYGTIDETGKNVPTVQVITCCVPFDFFLLRTSMLKILIPETLRVEGQLHV